MYNDILFVSSLRLLIFVLWRNAVYKNPSKVITKITSKTENDFFICLSPEKLNLNY